MPDCNALNANPSDTALLSIKLCKVALCQGSAIHENALHKNKAEGVAFLKENQKNRGVITLPDGLQYKIITQGKGKKPTETDVVSVNYRGTFIDGKEFDSSYKRHEPASFPVGGVIPGWTEALKLMPVGSTWILYIPSDLAYGEQGSPPAIPANKILIFKVELLGIKS